MAEHRFIKTIKTYYQGCNSRDFDLMVSTFADDVVHYFVDHSPVIGAEALANYCLLYTSPSPRDRTRSRMPSSA